MPLTDPELWNVIGTWPLPTRAVPIPLIDPHRRHDFAALLYKSSGWHHESVDRVIEIYRKFLYLKAISPRPVTPSHAIDTAWHLHLEFVEDYLALCRATGRDLRHDRNLTHDVSDRAYLSSLALYESEFDIPPDDDLWPSPAATADTHAKAAVGIAVIIVVGVPFLAAVSTGSGLLWLVFGFAICIGFGINNWAERRWPRWASLAQRENY
jgi:hypothetical protein